LSYTTFSGNSALWGGGIYNVNNIPQINNTILWENTAAMAGGQVFNDSATPILENSVVQYDCPPGSNCTNILTADPLLGTLGEFGGLTQTIPLQAGSSAIDQGDDSNCPATDQRGAARPQGPKCDIGAYEYGIFNPTISGNAGEAYVTMTWDGGSMTTNWLGDYKFSVPSGWSGTVTPSKTGYTFTPGHLDYTTVTTNQSAQNYTAALAAYTISGNAGVAGATLTYTGGSTSAGGSGEYAFTVPHGWSGTVTPSKTGYIFSPAWLTYLDVLANLPGQDYAAAAITRIHLPLIFR
jgi:hypothetical protein